MTDPVAWAFPVGGEMAEQLEWETDALSAETGPDQTRRLRAFPRVLLRFEGLEAGEARRWLESMLWHHGGGRWYVPLPNDAARTTADAVMGAEALEAPTAHARYAEGGYALLQGEGVRDIEVVQVASAVGDTIGLAEPTERAWPTGTRITPVRLGRLTGAVGLGRFTADATGLYQVQFRLDEPLDGEADFGDAVYRGYPVLEWRPVWTADPTWSPEHALVAFDEGVAPPAVADLVGQARDRQVLQFALTDADEVVAFRALLYALGGRWAPIWVPTWAQDLRVVASVANGATTLDVEGPLPSAFPLASNRRDLRIELVDGSVLYRRITAAVAHTPTVDRLTLDAPIATGFTASAVALVSYLVLSRQDADINVLRHFDWQTVQCELTFRGEVHAL
ncbi:hypothetical protein [Pseudoxanthomonas sp. SE1]|uniref:hypothetical protein n=1 Tax=Pseudoxanthomonas sp. SE1 TaxID=1664560 RepID=UPI00240DADDB|nr:hypothetical protein [Pseudoxanthomonas sp. SE1]WFC43260.1 hypothetical protein OY559_07040 [Pseudoxanthomonas sp. SE1]